MKMSDKSTAKVMFASLVQTMKVARSLSTYACSLVLVVQDEG